MRAVNVSAVNVATLPVGPEYQLSNVVEFAAGTEVFDSEDTLVLRDGAPGIDTGSNVAGLPYPLGVGLGGTDRFGRTPDQGAYEQGL